jgi:hypothetical protein
MTLETLNSAEFLQLSDDDAREVLGGLAAESTTTADGQCILDGQAVKDYKTDPGCGCSSIEAPSSSFERAAG